MDAKQILMLKPMLMSYLRQFGYCFVRSEPVAHVQTYALGQLSDFVRKSVEPISDQAGIPPRTLQDLLSRHTWALEQAIDRLQHVTGRVKLYHF